MEYKVSHDGEWVVIKVNGAINYESSDILRSVFEKILAEGTKKVRLNLKNVPVSDSAGVGIILLLYRNLQKRDGELIIRGISQNLKDMLSLVKVDKLIPIEDEE